MSVNNIDCVVPGFGVFEIDIVLVLLVKEFDN